jgi:hypothetical protein
MPEYSYRVTPLYREFNSEFASLQRVLSATEHLELNGEGYSDRCDVCARVPLDEIFQDRLLEPLSSGKERLVEGEVVDDDAAGMSQQTANI